MRPLRIADLFCGAGAVADGLRALPGVEIVGVDLVDQPHYPGPFLKHDALTLDDRFLAFFDGFWASPPCLRDTAMKHAPGAKGDAHPELIAPTRAMLQRTGKPFVIENVVGAALIDPLTLCGSMFGLGATVKGRRYHLRRHRLFEANFELKAPGPCQHEAPVVGVYGGHARVRAKSAGGRKTADPWPKGHLPVMLEAMGLDAGRGLTCEEVSQGIPPAFARHVGAQLVRAINERFAA